MVVYSMKIINLVVYMRDENFRYLKMLISYFKTYVDSIYYFA